MSALIKSSNTLSAIVKRPPLCMFFAGLSALLLMMMSAVVFNWHHNPQPHPLVYLHWSTHPTQYMDPRHTQPYQVQSNRDGVVDNESQDGMNHVLATSDTHLSSSLARQVMVIVAEYRICDVTQKDLDQVISEISTRDSTLGKSLHEWHSRRIALMQRFKEGQLQMEYLRRQNNVLQDKVAKSESVWSLVPSSPALDKGIDLSNRVKAVFDKNMYRQSNPDIDVRLKASFDDTHYYLPQMGIGGNPSTPLTGDYRSCVDEVMGALDSAGQITQGGLFRTHRVAGTLYEVFVNEKNTNHGSNNDDNIHDENMKDRNGNDNNNNINNNKNITKNTGNLIHYYFLKPFTKLHFLSHDILLLNRKAIHIILPVGYDVKNFKRFISHYIQYTHPCEYPWLLTVLYTGPGDKGVELKLLLHSKFGEAKCLAYRYITMTTRSIGTSIVRAVTGNWLVGDLVTMVTNVHCFFNAKFLQQCQFYARQGTQGYFPIAFGLYNNELVPLPTTGSYLYSRYGRWLDVEAATFCLYRSDLLRLVDRLDKWEDNFQLLQSALASDLMVVRSPDQSLFKFWHEIHCNPLWEEGRYKRCMDVKTHTLANIKQLGEIIH